MVAEAFDLAVIEQQVDDDVLVAQTLQRGGVGGEPGLGLLLWRKPHLVEEHLAQLRGGVDVELVAGGLVDRRRQAGAFAREPIV